MIKIGMIGMSPGNAHPYSWTAIINGLFSRKEIDQAGFPAVSDYLEANHDTLGIAGAQVTHIFCDDLAVAKSIAHSGGIETVVSRIEDFIGQVDAIILGRDDPENHLSMARPLLEAQIPMFIDKPLSINLAELEVYENYIQKGGFIMSCSSMRYAPEVLAVKSNLKKLGDIQLLTVVGKKDWKKYGIHMVEACMSLLNDPKPMSVQYHGKEHFDIVQLQISPTCFASIHLIADIVGTFQMNVFGRQDWAHIDIKNSYAMFKENILEFVKGLNQGKPTLDFEKTKSVIQIIAGALESKNSGNIKID
ncbi:MAG: Gfo/Idh/MocA family oxidoreductase, partial [Sphingobacterium sp.]